MRVARPPIKVLVPNSAPSARKVTDPAGVPEAEVTEAIKVMLRPTADGFWDDVKDVDVIARIFSVSAAEVLGA